MPDVYVTLQTKFGLKQKLLNTLLWEYAKGVHIIKEIAMNNERCIRFMIVGAVRMRIWRLRLPD